MKLLSRDQFDKAVKARSAGCCVLCESAAIDAHHLLERKLWADGGYYVENGVALCAEHHWKAETTEISVEALRLAAGIDVVLLPPGFHPACRYDKWGNLLREDGMREYGPLGNDPGCQRALTLGGLRGLFVPAGTPLAS